MKLQNWATTPFYHKIYENYDLTTTEVLLYGVVKKYIDTYGVFDLRNSDIQDLFSCSHKTISKAFSKLNNYKLLNVRVIRNRYGTSRIITLR